MPVLEFLQKPGTLKVGMSEIGQIWKCPLPPPPGEAGATFL